MPRIVHDAIKLKCDLTLTNRSVNPFSINTPRIFFPAGICSYNCWTLSTWEEKWRSREVQRGERHGRGKGREGADGGGRSYFLTRVHGNGIDFMLMGSGVVLNVLVG